MGACLSRKSTTASASKAKIVRVVQLNGCVQDFTCPVLVREVLTGGYPSKHLVCTPAQLLSGNSKPLNPETILEPGQIYFRLPYSLFQSDVSPMDLAPMAKKLNKIAKQSHNNKDKSKKSNFLNMLNSPASSPNRLSNRGRLGEPEGGGAGEFGMESSCKSGSWKPILASIRERSISINSRSESDLQDKDWES